MTPGPSTQLEDFSALWKCFPPTEVRRMREAVSVVPSLEPKCGREVEEVLRQAARSLPPVADAIQACPNVLSHQSIAGRERSAESLVDALCSSHDGNMEFLMPTGAILGRAFMLAKLNFLKALAYALDAGGGATRDAVAQVKETISDTVFSKLAEELLTSAISNPLNPMDLKRAAARKLLGMWSNRLQVPVGDFPSVLLSAWRARVKVRAIYGTLIGVNEVFTLIQEECESRFVNFFVREHVTSDEREAFREFLFGLSYEELEQLRLYMQAHDRQVIAPDQVKEILSGRVLPPNFADPSPEQVYNSYCRRRLRADYRAMSGAPGPRKTAEGYMMESLLREGA